MSAEDKVVELMANLEAWCDDRGECLRNPDEKHFGCWSHSAKTGLPCRSGWSCPHHGRSPWNAALDWFGDLYGTIYQRFRRRLETMADDELREILAAADHLTGSNCGWTTHRAAPIAREIASELLWMRGSALLRQLVQAAGTNGSTS